MTNTYIILQCPPIGGQMLLDFLKHHGVKPYMVVTGTEVPNGCDSFIHLPPLPASSRATDMETIELEMGREVMVEVKPIIDKPSPTFENTYLNEPYPYLNSLRPPGGYPPPEMSPWRTEHEEEWARRRERQRVDDEARRLWNERRADREDPPW